MTNSFSKFKQALFNLSVIIAGLGYFVDMFDLTLFGVIRVESLKALGFASSEDILRVGINLYNMQMLGMMLGGIFWGYITDKKGRLSVMFLSILLYSVGNIANAFVTTETQYMICRFITGLGLAGELGAAITLVVENLSIELRGWGTTVVATLGLLGAVVASLVGQYLHWQVAYILGGCLGLLLLFSRLSMKESALFAKHKESQDVKWGSWNLIFQKSRFSKFMSCIFIGAPIYLMTGILFTFSPEITQSFHLDGTMTAGNALLYGTLGLTFGDLLSGLISQIFQNRKKVLIGFLLFTLSLCLLYISGLIQNVKVLLWLCFFIGLGAGYWAVLMTTAAEQFGTNIRGTVTSTIPNFIRGFAILITLSFKSLKAYVSIQEAVFIIIVSVFCLAFFGVFKIKETYHQNLDFYEK